MPASARSSDDLPEPTGPTTSTSCPRSTVRSMSRTPTVPSSCTALNPASSSRRSGWRGAAGGRRRGAGGEVHARHGAEYAPTPVIATVRRVQTRAEGSCETSDAVVQANQRAAPSVDTATRVGAGGQAAGEVAAPRRAIGSSPLTHRRASSGPRPASRSPGAAGRCGRASSRARWASTGAGRPGQLHRAGRGQRRHQRGGERGPGGDRPARGALQHAARTASRPAPETTHRAGEEQRRHRASPTTSGHRRPG